ncbi:MAG: hypothetical protein HMLKMBBP_02721 [Planctomycetes bacterium]|nr:hypothetical protein [Planctomycetota bacterium]
MKKHLGVLSLLAAAAAGAAAVPALSQDDKRTPFQTGVVDMARVLAEYRKAEQVEAALKSRSEALDKEFKETIGAARAKQEKLATLNRDSEEFVKLEREITAELARIDADGKWNQKRLERDRDQRLCALYAEANAEVRLQAESKGLAAVFNLRPLLPGWERSSDPDAVLAGRTVLWADASVDLTQPVIEALNAKLPK